MRIINKLVNKAPWIIIISVVLITLFFGSQAVQVEVETDMKEMFPEGHSALEIFEQVSDDYGGAEYIIVIFRDSNILTQESLQNIDLFTGQMEDIEGTSNVRSITNVEEVRGRDFTVDVAEYMDQIPQTEAELEALRKDLINRDRYLGSLVGEELETASVIVQLEPDADQQKVVRDIEQLVEQGNFEEEIYLSGSPVMSQILGDIIFADIITLLPLVSFMVLLILFLSFRSIRGTLLPLVIVLFSVIWTIGLMSLMGYSLTQLSSVLPVLLVSVGSAYAIHFLARYYEDLMEGASEKQAISSSIIYVGAAIAMAGITTIIGFSSLGLSELTLIQEFGLFTAFGVFSALLLSTTFLPAVLLKLKSSSRASAQKEKSILNRLFSGLYYLVQNKYNFILVLVLLVIILSVIVIPRIIPETNYISFFDEDSRSYEAHQILDDKLGGFSTFEIVINSGRTDGAEDYEFLKRVQKFQNDLETNQLLSNSMSVVDLLKEANKAMHDGDEVYEQIPETPGGIAQYYMLLSSGSNILDEFIDFDHREAKIRISAAETGESKILTSLIEYTEEKIEEHFPDYEYVSREEGTIQRDSTTPAVVLTGVPVLTDVLSDLIIRGQIRSLIAAVVLAFVVTSILLKSPLKGFACSFPVAFTVLVNFGIMGWTAVTLNVATSMIASVAVGIGVDYGIHYYTRFLEELEEGYSREKAIKKAIFTVGRANFVNCTAVIAGFLVLLLSNVPPLRTFGLLTSLTMLVSFLGAMVILPSLLMFKQQVLLPLWKKNNKNMRC